MHVKDELTGPSCCLVKKEERRTSSSRNDSSRDINTHLTVKKERKDKQDTKKSSDVNTDYSVDTTVTLTVKRLKASPQLKEYQKHVPPAGPTKEALQLARDKARASVVRTKTKYQKTEATRLNILEEDVQSKRTISDDTAMIKPPGIREKYLEHKITRLPINTVVSLPVRTLDSFKLFPHELEEYQRHFKLEGPVKDALQLARERARAKAMLAKTSHKATSCAQKTMAAGCA
jgi:hypothetical protein